MEFVQLYKPFGPVIRGLSVSTGTRKSFDAFLLLSRMRSHTVITTTLLLVDQHKEVFEPVNLCSVCIIRSCVINAEYFCILLLRTYVSQIGKDTDSHMPAKPTSSVGQL